MEWEMNVYKERMRGFALADLVELVFNVNRLELRLVMGHIMQLPAQTLRSIEETQLFPAGVAKNISDIVYHAKMGS
jgi:hypothetical protein